MLGMVGAPVEEWPHFGSLHDRACWLSEWQRRGGRGLEEEKGRQDGGVEEIRSESSGDWYGGWVRRGKDAIGGRWRGSGGRELVRSREREEAARTCTTTTG